MIEFYTTYTNEILWFSYLLGTFFATIAIFRMFGYQGLTLLVTTQVIVANIGVLKQLTLFGMDVTEGNVAFVSIFLATDMITEFYGKEKAKRTVYLSFLALIIFTVSTQVFLLFIPNSFDFAQESLKTLFSLTPRITIASLLSYFLSQRMDIYLYDAIHKRLPETKYLFVRNNGSTLLSQLFDSIFFTLLAFYGTFTSNVLIDMIIFTYIIKIIATTVDTFFIYWAKYMREPFRKYSKNVYTIRMFEKHGVLAGITTQSFTEKHPYTSIETFELDYEAQQERDALYRTLFTLPKEEVIMKQYHSAQVHEVTMQNKMNIEEGDALYTTSSDIILSGYVADCLPVYIISKTTGICALVHSGWKGSLYGIVPKTVQYILETYRISIDDIMIAFGPSPKKGSYEVQEAFFDAFAAAYPFVTYDNYIFEKKRGKIYFHNSGFVRQQLEHIGVNVEHIFESSFDTFNGPFHSYRTTQTNARNIIFIGKK